MERASVLRFLQGPQSSSRPPDSDFAVAPESRNLRTQKPGSFSKAICTQKKIKHELCAKTSNIICRYTNERSFSQTEIWLKSSSNLNPAFYPLIATWSSRRLRQTCRLALVFPVEVVDFLRSCCRCGRRACSRGSLLTGSVVRTELLVLVAERVRVDGRDVPTPRELAVSARHRHLERIHPRRCKRKRFRNWLSRNKISRDREMRKTATR